MEIRYDLIPPHGLNEVNKVFSTKLEKYEKNKWKDGIAWSEVLSNLKKHLIEYEQGNDFTDDGLLNMAHVAEDALIFYNIHIKNQEVR